jgi:hypothetical protein
MVRFLTKNPNLGKLLEGLRMKNVCIFYDHLESFGIVCGHSVYFLHFGMFGPRKIWQPWVGKKLTQLMQCYAALARELAIPTWPL